jgi:hypothetical protein
LFALQKGLSTFSFIFVYFIFIFFSFSHRQRIRQKQPIMIDQAIRLSKRIMDPESPPQSGTSYELPWWTALIILANFIIFLPFVIYVNYTLKHVIPTFAIIEDENPPAYQPVSLNDDDAASLPEDPERVAAAPGVLKADTLSGGRTVTSSIKSVHRLLRANGGFRAFFRGLSIYVAQGLCTSILVGIFSGALGGLFSPLATLLASLTLVQFSTAWVHIVMTPSSPKHFWSRLPPFRRAFEATWRPVAIYWLAAEVTRWAPFLLLSTAMPWPELDESGNLKPMPKEDYQNFAGLGSGAFLLSVFCSVFLVLPAHVILTRVQASLLPVEEDTIIPFDRSFEGKVEPAIVGGRGYATIADAWATYSRSAWRRLIWLHVKIALVTIAFGILAVIVLVPQVFAVMANAKEIKS